MVTRWSRSTSNFYALIGQNLTGEFMPKIYAASWNLFTLTAEADRVLCELVMFFNVFFHWMFKMKCSCYQESSVIHGWFFYWVFGWELQQLETCLLWQLKLTEFCVNLWCFLMSFPTGCIKWNTAAINSLLLFMAVFLLNFWLRNAPLVELRNPISDDIVFIFHLAGCGLKSPSSDSGLTWWLSGAASRMVTLSNYCICVCLFVFLYI